MNQRPYRSYRGRKGPLRTALIAIVILLVAALCLALAGLFILPNYMVYTADGPQLALPFFNPDRVETPPEDADQIIIDLPSAPPQTPPPAQPEATAAPDLSVYPRRSVPLGLVSVARGKDPGKGRGAIYTMTDFDPKNADAYAIDADAVLAVPYVAAYLAPDWSKVDSTFTAQLTEQAMALAGLGFDELLFSAAPTAAATADLADCYTAVRTALKDAGYKGRFGLVVNQNIFTAKLPAKLAKAMAKFDRLYFTTPLQDKVSDTLNRHGWSGNMKNIVTVRNAAPSKVNWSWAVLK